jgi:hypothetical protein
VVVDGFFFFFFLNFAVRVFCLIVRGVCVCGGVAGVAVRAEWAGLLLQVWWCVPEW